MVTRKAVKYLSRKLSHYPTLKYYLKKLYYSKVGQTLWNNLWSIEVAVKSFLSDDDFKTIQHINPNRVKFDVAHFYVHRNDGPDEVISGDWDQDLISLDVNPYKQSDYSYERYGNVEVVHAIRERFTEGKEWEDTEFYKRSIRRLEADQELWSFNASTKEELDEKCAEVDELYNEIAEEGYHPQSDLDLGYKGDEISVIIDRKGQYLFNDGIHRFAIIREIGLDEIPVIITARHKKWVRFRQKVRSKANEEDQIYQQIPHPDINFPAMYGDKRWEIIEANLSSYGGSALDIGSKWGYFCHKLEDIGYDCTAIEYNSDNIEIMKKIKDAEEKKFDIYNGSVFDFDNESAFDVVIAMNIFHHFLCDRKSHEKLSIFLERVEIGELYLQVPPRIDESIERNPYRNYDAGEMCDFVINNSPSLDSYTRIGEVNSRPMFKIK